jgi:membrane fusion protein (multidrug efflux system)
MSMRNSSFVLFVAGLFFANVVFLTGISSNAKSVSPKDQGLSVLVQLTKLEKGSLPRIVTAFGRVETSPSAQQTIQAPVSAVVEEVYARPGQELSEGAPLVRLGPSPGTAAAYTQALSARRAAREAVRRTRSLLGQHLATRQQLTDAEKAAADAQASLTALNAEGAGSPQILRAPFHAIVTMVSTSRGAIVAQGAALLELARPNGLILRAGLVPDRADTVHIGDTGRITSLGIAQAVSGSVLLRGSMIDPQTGLVSIDIALPPGSLLPGQMAEAAIVTGKVEGYVVPHAAILVDDNGAPYLVQAVDGVAKKVAVQVLLAEGGKDVVQGQLDPAAALVLAGNYQLDDGMRVRTADPGKTAGK